MARMIDADAFREWWLENGENEHIYDTNDILDSIDNWPTLTPPNASPDLISRSALLEGETEPEIITGSDSELAEQFEWRRWVDKIKGAPAAGKEEEP